MKAIFFIIVLHFFVFITQAQNKQIDSLKQSLSFTKEDTSVYNICLNIGWQCLFSYSDTARTYAEKALVLSKKLAEPNKEAEAFLLFGYVSSVTGDYVEAIDYLLKGLHIEEQRKSNRFNNAFYIPIPMLQMFYYVLSETYKDFGDYEHALYYLDKGKVFHRENDNDNLMESLMRRSQIFDKLNRLDSALIFAEKAYSLDTIDDGKSDRAPIYITLGGIYYKKKNYLRALQYYHIAEQTSDFSYANKDVIEVYNGIADTYTQMNMRDSAIFYASKALNLQNKISYPLGALKTYGIFSEIFKKQGQLDSAIKYIEQSVSLQNTIFNQQNEREVHHLSFNEKLREQELIAEQEQYRNKVRLYAVLIITVILLFTALVLWRNIQHRKTSYRLLQQQKEETDKEKERAEHTLVELKSTQSQLIQSEKMASLGELTAGIAHEIQNPLNFVNNFSEVNTELIGEMKNELNDGNTMEAIVIANTIEENEQKINLHGKRADAIVKGMIQHSRIHSGQEELTDINALADEYLRLGYHGFRAKDKSFNTSVKTDYDETIDKIKIIPQDIGRVLLNLYNNAFYSVAEKSKQHSQNLPAGQAGYEPTISLTTKKISDKVEVRVKDNGNGIPQKVVDKIFQPFFTTKPTGQGTGLGLSLSYDVIKAHGGELNVQTKEGEGAEFIISLPAK
ncbi:hypothetical protein BH20BAC1_BH20BAC1_24130 [soil metagenome]